MWDLSLRYSLAGWGAGMSAFIEVLLSFHFAAVLMGLLMKPETIRNPSGSLRQCQPLAASASSFGLDAA